MGDPLLEDHTVRINNIPYISKLVINEMRPLSDLAGRANLLTHPYQVIISSSVKDQHYIRKVIELLTSTNPFTPLELIFLEPVTTPDTNALMSAIQLKRPHYLDNDLRFLYGAPGSRSVIFTLVSQHNHRYFSGEMKRQVYWWQQTQLPELADLQAMKDLDGILIDASVSSDAMFTWQNQFATYAEDVLMVSFGNTALQKRWLELTAPDEYYQGVF